MHRGTAEKGEEKQADGGRAPAYATSIHRLSTGLPPTRAADERSSPVARLRQHEIRAAMQRRNPYFGTAARARGRPARSPRLAPRIHRVIRQVVHRRRASPCCRVRAGAPAGGRAGTLRSRRRERPGVRAVRRRRTASPLRDRQGVGRERGRPSTRGRGSGPPWAPGGETLYARRSRRSAAPAVRPSYTLRPPALRDPPAKAPRPGAACRRAG